MTDGPASQSARPLFEAHGRSFQANRYVYPVLSRRAGGISVGVNLNLDKRCNFDCIYCQVDRSQPGRKQPVDIQQMADELDRTVELVTSGRIYHQTKFRQTPPPLRRLNDIALSGDGEPTTCGNFEQVVAACAEVRRRRRLAEVKLVLFTNASMLHREHIRRALDTLGAGGGEVWAKLDAGSQDYHRRIARTAVPLERILRNITQAAQHQPVVIQSLLMRIGGQPPPPAEQLAYCDRLREILTAGGQIKMVQIYTIARVPAESCVEALSEAELATIAELVRQQTGLAVRAF